MKKELHNIATGCFASALILLAIVGVVAHEIGWWLAPQLIADHTRVAGIVMTLLLVATLIWLLRPYRPDSSSTEDDNDTGDKI